MQSAAGVACRELGYMTGFVEFQGKKAADVSPPWLDVLHCDGTEASVRECETSAYGDTWRCGTKKDDGKYAMLYCSSGGAFPAR